MTKDKIQIWGSPLGMIMTPRLDFLFASANLDGTWNWEKINNFLFGIADRGANGFRDFGPWIDGPGMEKIAPWKYIAEKEKYDLSEFNQQYFDNLRDLAELAFLYNLDFCIDILNSSETRVAGAKEWTPWKRNVQGLENYFYKEDAFPFIIKLVKKLIRTFEGLNNIYYQTCNEPSIKGFNYLALTYTELIENGVKLERIFTGMDPLRKNTETSYGNFYRNFRKSVCAVMRDKNYERYIKENSWSGLHAASKENMNLYFVTGLKDGEKVPSNANRLVSYSDDGLRSPHRPTFNETYNSTSFLLQTKKDAYKRGKLGRELIVGKRAGELVKFDKNGYDGTPLKSEFAGLEGAVEAFKMHTGKYPENYKKFGKALELPEWLIDKKEPVEPVKPVEPVEPIEPVKPEPVKPGKGNNILDVIKKKWKLVVIIIIILIILSLL